MTQDRQQYKVKGPLVIVELTAENIKKVKAVRIRPDGAMVQITGANGNGKTSVLDSIFLALDQKVVDASMPIRNGAQSAKIKLDMGEIIVERRITPKGTTLEITAAETGVLIKPPQTFLSALLGSLSFDPTAFERMDAKAQYEALRKVVKLEVDLELLSAQNEADFARRTDVNRDVKTLEARLAAMPIPAPDLPAEPIDQSELLDEMQAATDHNQMVQTRIKERDDLLLRAGLYQAQAAKLREHAALLREQVAAQEREADENDAQAKVLAERHTKASVPDPIDTAELRRRYDNAGEANQRIGAAKARRVLQGELQAAQKRAAALTDAMASRETAKREAIAKAELPVPGLGFGEGIVTLNGIPFKQASTAERLRVSVALAMSSKSPIRILRIEHGNDLDENSLALIAKMAAEKGWQVWLERVEQSGKVGVTIVDGEVSAVNGVPVTV